VDVDVQCAYYVHVSVIVCVCVYVCMLVCVQVQCTCSVCMWISGRYVCVTACVHSSSTCISISAIASELHESDNTTIVSDEVYPEGHWWSPTLNPTTVTLPLLVFIWEIPMNPLGLIPH